MNFKSIFTQYIVPVIGLLILSAFFFYPQLQNKSLATADISAFKSSVQEVKEYKEETGIKSMWTNSIFGGMPTYQINGNAGPNLLKYVDRALHLFISRPIGLFFMIMLCTYLSLLLFGSSPWVSFFGASVVGLSVSNFILFDTGHMTKVKTIGYCIPIFMGLFLAYQRNRLVGLSIYGLALGLALFSKHPQMLYYLLFSLVIMGVIAGVDALKKKKLADFAITTGGIIAISLVALASSASNMLPTLEYAKDTMRGEPILTTSSNTGSKSSEVDGLDWQYATNWSNGFLDLVTTYIPGAVGGSSAETAPSGSVTVKNLQRKGARISDDAKLPLYWGAMNNTGGVFYFGAVLFFLLILQLFIGNKKLSIWLAATLILMAMISMGRNLEWFNKFLFDHLPYYNKFRTPNSVSSVMTAIFGLGAAFGLHALVTYKGDMKKLKQAVIYSGGILAAISLFFILVGPSIFDFSHPNDAAYAQQGFDLNDLRADRKKMLRMDAFRSLIFVVLAAGTAWLFVSKKIKQPILIAAITIFAVVDITGIGRRYLSNEDFKPNRQVNTFSKRPADEQILSMEKERGAYRVYDLSISTFNSVGASYWYNQIGGYHPAKLQRFEDIKNYHLLKGNQAVLNMLNAKYIITREGQVQQNPGALGNAWLVDNIQFVESNDEEISALNNFNPSATAIVHKTFRQNLDGMNPTGNGSVQMTSYAPNKISYQSNTSSEELVVFSEVWYGPDKGWEVTIDGNPAELVRVNYVLRGVKVPAGQHEIVMEFNPTSVATGNTLTLISSILLILFAGFVMYRSYLRTAKETEPAIERVVKKEQPKKARRKKKTRK